MTAKSVLEGMKNLCSLDGFEIFSGYGLSYEDFENGKMIETGGLKPKSICISHDGLKPFGINEDSTHSKTSVMVSVFLKTNEEPEMYVDELIDYINSNNRITTGNNVYTVEFVGATPIVFEKNNIVFMIDYEIN